MKGLLKKDIFLVSKNFKLLLVVIVIYSFMAITNDVDVSSIIPFMAAMLCSSSFSYDDISNWQGYGISLPQGKKNAVTSKYLAAIILTTVATIVDIVISIAIYSYKNTLVIKDLFSSIGIGVVSVTLLVSILYPFLFKFGTEKGKYMLLVVGFAMFGIGTLLANSTLTIPVNLLTFFNKFSTYILTSACIIMLGISYLISRKIYSKKEF